MEARPGDWKPAYYLGNLLTTRMRWEEGLRSFQKAESFSPSFSVLYRNLGEIYWRKLRDYARAETEFEKAARFAPADYTLYVSLDELYAINRSPEKREKLFRRAPNSVKGNFNYVLQRGLFFHDEGRYADALEVLAKNSFLPWEGWSGAKDLYTLAHLARAGRNFTSGKIPGFHPGCRSIHGLSGEPGVGRAARHSELPGILPDRPGPREAGRRGGSGEFFRKAVDGAGDKLKGRYDGILARSRSTTGRWP